MLGWPWTECGTWTLAMTSFDSKKLSHIHHELHTHLPSEPALRTKALESLLTDKKLLNAEAIDAWIEMYRDEIGPKRRAVVVGGLIQRSRRGCWKSQPPRSTPGTRQVIVSPSRIRRSG
jgi:hypothetical protein